MSRFEISLWALLILQLIVWSGLELSKPERDALIEKSKTLIQMDLESVSSLELAGEEKSLSFKLENEVWKNKTGDFFPINQDQLNALIGKIVGLKRGLPVSVSEASHDRFKVSNDNFFARLVLKSEGGDKITVFFGEQPTLRQTYARLRAENFVFVVDIESWELDTGIDHWLDKKYLKIAADEVVSVRLKDFEFEKSGSEYHLKDTDRTEYDSSKISRFLKELFELRIESVVPDNLVSERNSEFEELFLFKKKNGTTGSVLIIPTAEEGKTSYFIKRSDREGVYTMVPDKVEKILAVSLEGFLLEAESN